MISTTVLIAAGTREQALLTTVAHLIPNLSPAELSAALRNRRAASSAEALICRECHRSSLSENIKAAVMRPREIEISSRIVGSDIALLSFGGRRLVEGTASEPTMPGLPV
jgi:hypothetical protein